MNTKVDTLYRSIVGNCKKIKFYIYYLLNLKIRQGNCLDDQVIVSLTSYGERVSSCAAYSIFSILKQEVKPSAVVLWLDKTKWNDDNLPSKIKYLMKYGLKVRYCEDIRSYTKLIPSLKAYPEKTIITVDDDVFYSECMLKELIDEHKKNPSAICCLHFCIVKTDSHNNISPYYEWEECHVVPHDREIDHRLIFPQGYGGVLYPPHVFDDTVFDITVAKQICPTADDVWFYCMGQKCNAKRVYPHNSKTKYYLVDMFRQLFKKDRLNESNVKIADNNEVQLKRVFEKYNICI